MSGSTLEGFASHLQQSTGQRNPVDVVRVSQSGRSNGRSAHNGHQLREIDDIRHCSRRGLAYVDFDGNAENSSINIRNYAEKGVVGAEINAYNIRIVAEIRHVYLE